MKKLTILILALSLLVPLLAYAILGGISDYNTLLWHDSGKIADENGLLNVYAVEANLPETFSSGYFAFPPPWLIISYVTYKIAAGSALDLMGFAYLIRLLPFLALETNALLVYLCLRKKGEMLAAIGAFLFSVAFGVVNWSGLFIHGQIDSIPIFFMLLALLLADKRKMDWAMLALGLGAAFKLYPLAVAVGFLAVEAGKGTRTSKLLKYAVLALAPLVVFSLPYLITNPAAYVGALTQYKDWVGIATLYAYVYMIQGLPLYLWRGPVPPNAAIEYIGIVTAVSASITMFALLLACMKIWKRKDELLLAVLLPLLTLLAFWKFIDACFLAWALPFTIMMTLSSERRWGGVIYLFTIFYIALLSFADPLNLLFPLAQLAAIVYYVDLVGR
ncbi:Glycosyltransferase family 87 [Candidatus Burarchaeum australiense]|nr:Glycosyltransferase family 87 [Candidatus Burarchaeum australiense]